MLHLQNHHYVCIMKRRHLLKSAGTGFFVAGALPMNIYSFSIFKSNRNNMETDVIIIGGSYAGLSAAMALGRSLKNVVIIDAGSPCNQQTPHSHNFVTHDGEEPSVIAQKAKEDVLRYDTVKFVEAIATDASKKDDKFEISLQNGSTYTATKLIFATGIKDTMPNIKGFAECWGISVVHCPYCHGYEFKGKKTAIMVPLEKVHHLGPLVNNLTDQLTIILSPNEKLGDDEKAKFDKHGIKVLNKEIAEVQHKNGYLNNVIFKDGTSEPFDAMYAGLPFTQHTNLPVELGCELNEQGYLKVDEMQHTTVPGIYACGDNASMFRSVASAVYTGNLAGAIANMELTFERF